MENNEMNTEKKRLIRRLHALRAQYGMTQGEYDALLSVYDVESSREMTEEQLTDVCSLIEELNQRSNRIADMSRRRMLAAACNMLSELVTGWDEMTLEVRFDYAKNTACRAAGMKRYDSHGHDNFNKISDERVRSLTYAFNRRRKDLDAVVDAATELIKSGESQY